MSHYVFKKGYAEFCLLCIYEKSEKNQKRKATAILIAMKTTQRLQFPSPKLFWVCPEIYIFTVVLLRKGFSKNQGK